MEERYKKGQGKRMGLDEISSSKLEKLGVSSLANLYRDVQFSPRCNLRIGWSCTVAGGMVEGPGLAGSLPPTWRGYACPVWRAPTKTYSSVYDASDVIVGWNGVAR